MPGYDLGMIPLDCIFGDYESWFALKSRKTVHLSKTWGNALTMRAKLGEKINQSLKEAADKGKGKEGAWPIPNTYHGCDFLCCHETGPPYLL